MCDRYLFQHFETCVRCLSRVLPFHITPPRLMIFRKVRVSFLSLLLAAPSKSQWGKLLTYVMQVRRMKRWQVEAQWDPLCLCLSACSSHQPPARNVQDLAGHEPRLIRCEQHAGVGNLFRRAQALQSCYLCDGIVGFLRYRFQQWGTSAPWRQPLSIERETCRER